MNQTIALIKEILGGNSLIGDTLENLKEKQYKYMRDRLVEKGYQPEMLDSIIPERIQVNSPDENRPGYTEFFVVGLSGVPEFLFSELVTFDNPTRSIIQLLAIRPQ